jgi:hypothetical protein
MDHFRALSRKTRTKETHGKLKATPSRLFRPLLESLEDRTMLANSLDPTRSRTRSVRRSLTWAAVFRRPYNGHRQRSPY